MLRLIPRLKPYYSLSDWIAAFDFFQKNPIATYENEFATKFANRYGVMFQHGRTGLYALLKVWGVKNEEVICPAYTCVVVPNAIVLSGNIPVFVDCAEGSFNMDLSLLEKSITPKTKAIVVTHLFGYPMDVRKIDEIVRRAEKNYGHKIYVIQDVAHSYGARWQGELVTTYGDAAIFGSNISKIINSIFGGMVVTNSEKTYRDLLLWREKHIKKASLGKSFRRFAYFAAVNIAFNSYVYGFVHWLERRGVLDKFVKYFEEDRIYFPSDWNVMPSNIEARIGRNQLKKYDRIVKYKIALAHRWMTHLKNEKILFFEDTEGATYSHCTGLVENREAWIKRYGEKGIQLGQIIEYAVPYLKAYAPYKKEEYPISLSYAARAINFPNHMGVRDVR